MAQSVSRRDFARLFAIGGSAALFADPVWAKTHAQAPSFSPTLAGSGEAFWKSVRAQFVMPEDLGVLNAANLCPASRPVLEALKRESDKHSTISRTLTESKGGWMFPSNILQRWAGHL